VSLRDQRSGGRRDPSGGSTGADVVLTETDGSRHYHATAVAAVYGSDDDDDNVDDRFTRRVTFVFFTNLPAVVASVTPFRSVLRFSSSSSLSFLWSKRFYWMCRKTRPCSLS